MNGSCADCVILLDHCHGTLVTHSNGGMECTDHQCTNPHPLRHALVIDCTSVTGGCCSDTHTEELARAS
jgi:hypothetical protein